MSRFVRLVLCALALTGVGLFPAFADESRPQDPTVNAQSRFEPESYLSGWLTSDRDEDGVVDYAVQVDDQGNKIREAMDFNYDGLMDDFYFYANDVLQRQEVDSNFDQQVDLWIYLWRGVYIQRWERDTDYDGRVDVVRNYDEPRE
jgi:hypothetical protein